MSAPLWFTSDRIDVLDDTARYRVVTPTIIKAPNGGTDLGLRVEVVNEWDATARLRGLDTPEEDGGALPCLFAAGKVGDTHVVRSPLGAVLAVVSVVSR